MTGPVSIVHLNGTRLTLDRSDIIGFWSTRSHPGRTTITVESLGEVVIDEPYESFIDRVSSVAIC